MRSVPDLKHIVNKCCLCYFVILSNLAFGLPLATISLSLNQQSAGHILPVLGNFCDRLTPSRLPPRPLLATK